MDTECHPISMLPHSSRLFLDFVERREPLAPFYVSPAYAQSWGPEPHSLTAERRATIASLLEAQNRGFGAGRQTLDNIERLRAGADAVVTGQQVVLFGGPLLTLLKAATAIRRARDATAAGHPQVPIFWLASEDHDLAEADHVVLPSRHELHTLRLLWPGEQRAAAGTPVGRRVLGDGIAPLLDEALRLLGPGPRMDELARCYAPDATFAAAFARWILGVFAEQGLIVIDAAGRDFHALGANTLRHVIVHAEDLTAGLLARDRELGDAGYHSQVLVAAESSLLFLIDGETGARQPLRRALKDDSEQKTEVKAHTGEWQAGRKNYSTEQLLATLETEPERLSPNALLRPVFQDTILPTASYVGGPAEIAYFAQSQVLYQSILGRTTPIVPRLSATLIEPSIAELLARFEISLQDVFAGPLQNLAQQIGARALPDAGKQRLEAAGDALDEELMALTAWMQALDADLGRSAGVAASKMRYQMSRLRRLASSFQLQRDAGIARRVDSLYLSLFPNRHPQERVIGGAWFLSRHGEGLAGLLVEHASQQCPGHKAIYL